MARKKPSLEAILTNPSEKLQALIRIIDQGIHEKQRRGVVEKRVRRLEIDDEKIVEYAMAYIDHLYDGDEPKPERTHEDMLEFGDLDDDDDKTDEEEDDEDDSVEEDMFEKLLNEFIAAEDEESTANAKAKKEEAQEEPGEYEFRCCVNDSPAEFLVEGMVDKIVPEEGLYVHVDLILTNLEQDGTLRIEVTTRRGTKRTNAFFTPEEVKLFHDGMHLHAPVTLLTDFFADDYKLGPDEEDCLIMNLYKDERGIYMREVGIPGPWPSGKRATEAEKVLRREDTPEGLLEGLEKFPGWRNFKKRMKEAVIRSKVDGLRKNAGLTRNNPVLHTLLIGGAGTGKTTAVGFLAKLYKMLGYLDTDEVKTTRLSSISTSHISEEYEKTIAAIDDAKGGVLVFENAQDLFRSESKNYDSEGNIVKALIDALEDRVKYPRWMLVLTGDPDGMELLLAKYPGLKKNFTAPIYMEDFTPEELSMIVDDCASERRLLLSEQARKKLQMNLLHQYKHRGPGFQNAWLVHRLFDDSIIPEMYARVGSLPAPTKEDLETILPEDIPTVTTDPDAGLKELDELIGLGKIKTRVRDYLNAVRLAGRRMELGLTTNMPRLHMAFLGNPGTGKTTVAEIIGKVFASWGILSGGRVIRTEKSQMVGQWIGETEQKMRDLLSRARGNVLFIDEAYQLVEGSERDYGRIVMNSLLTELGKDHQDMVVILAGYTAPMKKLLESNEGIESRFPNVFNFEDYTTDELVEIGKMMIRKQGFTLSDGAEANMRTIIEAEAEKPSPRFGNGRFVQNLLQNEILATLGARTAKIGSPTREQLSTILPEDVVIGKAQKDVVFDDKAIDAALERLDALAGLVGVKKAVHNFVQSARYLHSIGEPYVGKGLLSWRFIGKTGTGKSTVAEIMASILKGMRLIANNHITEVKGDRIFGVSEHDCDEVLKDAVKRSCNGLIFIDIDEPRFDESRNSYGRSIEQVHLKLKEMTVEAGGECALILAELDAPNKTVVEQLSEVGVYEFDHTLVFKDFNADELFQILCDCLKKYNVSFSPAAEKHIREYISSLNSSIGANARTMKLMARTIYQQVILRESGLTRQPKAHQVQLSDIETFKWNRRKGKIGF